MSTVVGFQNQTDVDVTYLVCVKGSPEVLKSMFVDAPMDYDDAYLQMARQGARVLALGHREIGRLSHQQVNVCVVLGIRRFVITDLGSNYRFHKNIAY